MLADQVEQVIASRLAGFPRFLRANGFAVGGGDVLPVMEVSQRLGILDSHMLRFGLRSLLCGRVDEWRRFPALFDAWFLPPNSWQSPEHRDVDGYDASGAQGGAAAHDRAAADKTPTTRHAASRQEAHSAADFRQLTRREHLLEIEALMRHFARRLKPLRLRRETQARRGRRIDLPATIRRSVASGGTPLHLAWRDRRRVEPRLVLLIDVSRSMAAYSFFYLRLARALSAARGDVYSFIFHTRVTAVSRALHDPDPWRAQEQLHLLAQGWAGGTRIGESLTQFNREHAAGLVHARTAVLVLSDGYDAGEPARLSEALLQLRRRARRIVWLNPLCKQEGYAHICQGMQAALPHLDLLAPAASLDDLRASIPALIEALR
jgi:uncharacterized protein with von Willebrand factor type A (vWA) domain